MIPLFLAIILIGTVASQSLVASITPMTAVPAIYGYDGLASRGLPLRQRTATESWRTPTACNLRRSGDSGIRSWECGDAQFTGKERDAETGLDFFGARYFSAAQGRFTSPDKPLADQSSRDPQSWNLYSYVRNNPLRFTDPTGMKCNAGIHDESGDACFDVTKTEGRNWFTGLLSNVGSFFQGGVNEGVNTFIGFANTVDSMRQATSGGPDLRQPLRVPSNDYQFVGGMYAMAFGMIGNPAASGAKVIGELRFSTSVVAQAAKEIEAGATSVRVATKSDAEEIFLRLFQGNGYRNTTGMDGVGAKQMFGSKAGTYHWDTAAGHGPGNPHGTGSHLQIHTEKSIVRIFYGPQN